MADACSFDFGAAQRFAILDVAAMVREQGRILDGLTAQEAAERAYRPGGPSFDALVKLAIARGRQDAP
ncbi:hypothetical protein CHE218_28180 [Microbacterium sp. che218]